MRKILLFILLISLKPAVAQEYFEGNIIFKTDIKVADAAALELQYKLQYKYGDSMKMYYSRAGDFSRKYINSGDTGNEYQTFLTKKKILYAKEKKSNYSIPVDVTVNSLTYVKKIKLPQEKILDLDCDCTEYKAKTAEDKPISIIYCYSKLSETLNFGAMEQYSDFFLNDFFINTQRPYLKFSMITSEYTLTYTALSMENTDLDRNIFKVDDARKREVTDRSRFF